MGKPYIGDKDLNELATIHCGKCDGLHFRHAGNVLTYRKYQRHDKKKVGGDPEEIDTWSNLVYICIGCGHPWVMVSGEMYDGSEYIDVKKFDKVNRALQDETKTDAHC